MPFSCGFYEAIRVKMHQVTLAEGNGRRGDSRSIHSNSAKTKNENVSIAAHLYVMHSRMPSVAQAENNSVLTGYSHGRRSIRRRVERHSAMLVTVRLPIEWEARRSHTQPIAGAIIGNT